MSRFGRYLIDTTIADDACEPSDSDEEAPRLSRPPARPRGSDRMLRSHAAESQGSVSQQSRTS